MNTQSKSASKFFQILLTALMLVTLVYGAMPTQTVHASSFLVNDLGDNPIPLWMASVISALATALKTVPSGLR